MAADRATPGARTRWLTLVAMTLANSMILVDQTAVPLAVPSLIHDLGAALGCGAALKGLRRLRSEPFGLERAVTWRELHELPPAEIWERAGIPLDRALETLPEARVDEAGEIALGYGTSVAVAPGGAPVSGGPRSVVIRGPSGRALAVGELVRTVCKRDEVLKRPVREI